MAQAPPRQSRLRELIAGYPPATLGITGVCGMCYLLTLFTDVPLGYVSINPYMAIYQYEFYRLFTSAVFHGGIMHIAMNMMSLQAMGTSLERLFGTTMFFLLNVGVILLAGAIYLTSCWILAYGLHDIEWLLYQSVGYSGVLFALAALESFLSPAPTRSIFGLITVPTRLYPWALLVVLQIMMPNISFLGHLSGLVVGLLFAWGKLTWAVPSYRAIQELESKPFMARLRAMNGFVPCPDRDPVAAGPAQADERSTMHMACETVGKFLAPVWRCVRVVVLPVYNLLLAPVVGFVSRMAGAARARVDEVRTEARNRQQLQRGGGTDWGGGVLGDGAQQPGAGAGGDIEMGAVRAAPTAVPPSPQPRRDPTVPPASAHTGVGGVGGDDEPTDAELYDFDDDDLGAGAGGAGAGGSTTGRVAGTGGDPDAESDDSDVYEDDGTVERRPLLGPASGR